MSWSLKLRIYWYLNQHYHDPIFEDKLKEEVQAMKSGSMQNKFERHILHASVFLLSCFTINFWINLEWMFTYVDNVPFFFKLYALYTTVIDFVHSHDDHAQH